MSASGIEFKSTNPKDSVGIAKVPMSKVPAITIAYLALGHAEGELKYGMVNWRETGVLLSVYTDAFERHVNKFKEGEWADPKTKVPHLANAMTCLSIIVDAHHAGVLIDDRPMSNPASIQFIEGEGVEILKNLFELFGGVKPRHYTIADNKLEGALNSTQK
jgi:hypothetical protein